MNKKTTAEKLPKMSIEERERMFEYILDQMSLEFMLATTKKHGCEEMSEFVNNEEDWDKSLRTIQEFLDRFYRELNNYERDRCEELVDAYSLLY